MAKWTKFWDMHSGGSQKLDWAFIFIEASKDEAEIIFKNRFGRNPNRVTCTCCGQDYSIDEDDSLEQSTAPHRNCYYAYFDVDGNQVPVDQAWKSGIGLINGCEEKYVEKDKYPSNYGAWSRYQTMDDFLKTKTFPDGDTVLVIYSKDIKPEEKSGMLHEEGYVWVN